MSGARPASSGAPSPSPPLPPLPGGLPDQNQSSIRFGKEDAKDRDGDGGEGVAAIFALDFEVVTTPEQVRDSETFKDRGSS